MLVLGRFKRGLGKSERSCKKHKRRFPVYKNIVFVIASYGLRENGGADNESRWSVARVRQCARKGSWDPVGTKLENGSIVIKDIDSASVAADAGLVTGDIIVEVNGLPSSDFDISALQSYLANKSTQNSTIFLMCGNPHWGQTYILKDVGSRQTEQRGHEERNVRLAKSGPWAHFIVISTWSGKSCSSIEGHNKSPQRLTISSAFRDRGASGLGVRAANPVTDWI